MDFRQLRVWQAAMELAEVVYDLVGQFPAEERYGLGFQLRKADVSVPSCIAEGNARESTRDYLRFLSMAKGSLAEIQTQALLAARLKLADSARVDIVLMRAAVTSQLLNALRKSLQDKLSNPPSSPTPNPQSRP